MIVAFDTFLLTKRFRNVGIYEYAVNLLKEFHEITREDASVSVRYFSSPGYSDDLGDGNAHNGCEPAPTSLLHHSRLWRLGLLSFASMRAGADIVFAPCVSVFPLRVLPVAVTIHDVMPERLPASLVERSTTLRAATWASAKLSHKIFTDSEYSKKDIVELYDVPPEKVSVVYLGYDRRIFNLSPPDAKARESLLKKLGIRGPYILHHGMVQLRKNLGRLVKAYELLRSRRDIGLQLVLAGSLGLGSKELVEEVHRKTSERDIIFTGPLVSNDLAILIKGALLCVIPSLYEGFCLPMIEAMACGVPTIVANSSCLPEVSGGVLRYFDPLSEEDIAAKIEDLLDHSEVRKEVATRGLQRANEFSWRRCARQTLTELAKLGPGVATASVG